MNRVNFAIGSADVGTCELLTTVSKLFIFILKALLALIVIYPAMISKWPLLVSIVVILMNRE